MAKTTRTFQTTLVVETDFEPSLSPEELLRQLATATLVGVPSHLGTVRVLYRKTEPGKRRSTKGAV